MKSTKYRLHFGDLPAVDFNTLPNWTYGMYRKILQKKLPKEYPIERVDKLEIFYFLGTLSKFCSSEEFKFDTLLSEIKSIPHLGYRRLHIFVGSSHLTGLYNKIFKFYKSQDKIMQIKVKEINEFESQFICDFCASEMKLEVRKTKNLQSFVIKKRKFSKITKGMSEIVEGFLFLGSIKDAKDVETLRENGIKRIVNISNYRGADYDPREFKVKEISIDDTEKEDIFKYFQEVVSFVNQNKEKILIHCIVGKSRSATLVIAVMMAMKKMNLKVAFEYVKKKRSLIRPNNRFMHDLRKWEIELYGKNFPESLSLKELEPVKYKNQKRKKKKKVDPKITALALDIFNEDLFTDFIKKGVQGEYNSQKFKQLLSYTEKRLLEMKYQLKLVEDDWKCFFHEAKKVVREKYQKKIKLIGSTTDPNTKK